jgi:hypothetical protein
MRRVDATVFAVMPEAAVFMLDLALFCDAPGENRTRDLRFERPPLFGSP